MELEQIVQMLLPVVRDVIGGMLMMSDSSLIGGVREAGAIGKYLTTASQEMADNPVIAGLVDGLIGEDGKVIVPDMDNVDVTNLFTNVGSAAGVLDSFEGGLQVKEFIYGMAEHIAGASGGGLFGGGQKISAGEQQFLDGLRAMLGL
ncbi:MAG: hypothetical protein IPK19_26120 [Chloroflexi bacterium]|nr:hypothetical protein [Chloroflexota bacterium]